MIASLLLIQSNSFLWYIRQLLSKNHPYYLKITSSSLEFKSKQGISFSAEEKSSPGNFDVGERERPTPCPCNDDLTYSWERLGIGELQFSEYNCVSEATSDTLPYK